jgi:hypothetical protein
MMPVDKLRTNGGELKPFWVSLLNYRQVHLQKLLKTALRNGEPAHGPQVPTSAIT